MKPEFRDKKTPDQELSVINGAYANGLAYAGDEELRPFGGHHGSPPEGLATPPRVTLPCPAPYPCPGSYRFGFLLGREVVIESLGFLPVRGRGGLCSWPELSSSWGSLGSMLEALTRPGRSRLRRVEPAGLGCGREGGASLGVRRGAAAGRVRAGRREGSALGAQPDQSAVGV